MAKLAVFDFDRTIVDDDSDATIIRSLREKNPPPEFDSNNGDWTPYMSDVFEHAFTSGYSPDQILSSIASMNPTRGMVELIKALHDAGWEILILSDANTVFIDHWINSRKLEHCITAVISNRAFFKSGRLYIEPYMRQTICSKCPSNLCKSLALTEYCSGKEYKQVVYSGDGRNDYCPSTKLPAQSIVFPRRGYPLDDLTTATLASANPQVVAKVVSWDDGYRILKELQLDGAQSIVS